VEERHLALVDAEYVAADLDVSGEPPVDGVASKQVGKLRAVGEVVDRDEFEIRVSLVGSPKRGATDAPETVDRHSDGHGLLLHSTSVRAFRPKQRATSVRSPNGLRVGRSPDYPTVPSGIPIRASPMRSATPSVSVTRAKEV
jgi:hypothetical protein